MNPLEIIEEAKAALGMPASLTIEFFYLSEQRNYRILVIDKGKVRWAHRDIPVALFMQLGNGIIKERLAECWVDLDEPKVPCALELRLMEVIKDHRDRGLTTMPIAMIERMMHG